MRNVGVLPEHKENENRTLLKLPFMIDSPEKGGKRTRKYRRKVRG